MFYSATMCDFNASADTPDKSAILTVTRELTGWLIDLSLDLK